MTYEEFQAWMTGYPWVTDWDAEMVQRIGEESRLVVTIKGALPGFDKALFAGRLRRVVPMHMSLQVRLDIPPAPKPPEPIERKPVREGYLDDDALRAELKEMRGDR